MANAAHSNRHAALNETAERAAGRRGRSGQHNEQTEAIRDTGSAPGKTKGAFGNSGTQSHGEGVVSGKGAGGGGDAQMSPDKDPEVGVRVGKMKKR